MNFIKRKIESLKSSLINNIRGKNAKWWLFGISFAESSFFPIPPDFYLMPVVAQNRSKWAFFAFITTISSVFGGLFGYFIGAVLFETVGRFIVETYKLNDELVIVSDFFNSHAFLSIFTAAFTPIPYKIFTIAAGLFKINIFIFVIASVLGRGIRFFAVSLIMKIFGEKISQIAFKYFNLFTLVFAIIAILFIVYKILF
jgi:membrane protein YqaA with SNARE-associated domain